MGEARRRAKEIQEIKRWGGRLMDTVKFDTPPFVRAGDDVWMITNGEFATWLKAAHDMTNPVAVQSELARLALIAERSGVRERECQQWFSLQLKVYADERLSRPMPKPIVFAQSSVAKKPQSET